MITTKYYELIEDFFRQDKGSSELNKFDLGELGRSPIAGRLLRSRFLHAALRRFCPILRIGNLAIVTRYDDVRFVRENHEIFQAPYGPEMQTLVGGKSNFLLGMGKTEQYDVQLAWISHAMRQSDTPLIEKRASYLTGALLNNCGGELDLVQDLLVHISSQTCAEYYGLDVEDYNTFAQWLMSMSALLFGDYTGSKKVRQLALLGAEKVRDVIRYSLRQEKYRRHLNAQLGPNAPFQETVLGRLLDLQQSNQKGPDDEDIVAILMGLAVGFVPTGAGAGGHIMEELLSRPDTLKKLHELANAGSSERSAVEGYLMEALRFRPPIIPGLPRYVTEDVEIAGRKIRAGSTVLAASMSAMFDRKKFSDASRFRPDRNIRSQDLNFGGDGLLHYCIGENFARAILIGELTPLLAQVDLRREKGRLGKIRHTGPFPDRLHVKFNATHGHRNQSFITVLFETNQKHSDKSIEQAVEDLNDVGLSAAFESTEIVHFAHVSPIIGHLTANHSQADGITHLLLELSTDGEETAALDSITPAIEPLLRPLLETHCSLQAGDDFASYLESSMLKLSTKHPHSRKNRANGLNFHGTPQLAVSRILRDDQVVRQTRIHLNNFLSKHRFIGEIASAAIASLRNELKNGPYERDLVLPVSQHLRLSNQLNNTKGKALQSFLKQPSVWGTIVALFAASFMIHAHFVPGPLIDLSTWETTRLAVWSLAVFGLYLSIGAGVAAVSIFLVVRARTRDSSSTPGLKHLLGARLTMLSVTTVILATILFVSFDPLFHRVLSLERDSLSRLWLIFAVYWEVIYRAIIAVLSLLVIAGAAVGILLYLLRASETRAVPDNATAAYGHLEKLYAQDNRKNHAQNHIIAVTKLNTDPRWLRRGSLAFAFWGIEQTVKHFFRPGFVLDMGTIHYARWFRIPKTDTLVFVSNYDGSWESYLEDFITKAHQGQSAVWSNGVGFPETRFLIQGGAARGVQFKRWVRRQQTPTRYWFSRYPHLTTDQIRNNALIVEGLAKARTETESRALLDLFGSRPMDRDELETDEIQSLILSGLVKHRAAEVVPVWAPQDAKSLHTWLRKHLFAGEHDEAKQSEKDVLNNKSIRPNLFSFGEPTSSEGAINIAFSRSGMKKLGMDELELDRGEVGRTTLNSFPHPFLEGMESENRAGILGDQGISHPDEWSWRRTDQPNGPDFILLIYASCNDALNDLVDQEKKILRKAGFTVYADECIRTQLLPDDPRKIREPFGFRDGLSQPIVRGTRRYYEQPDSQHVVEPGEVLLGYPDNRGQFSPSPLVKNARFAEFLPNLPDFETGIFPNFTKKPEEETLDLGRNGSFLVLRQLEQDVEAFENYLQDETKRMDMQTVEGQKAEEWLAAKMMGRWKDGSPLVRHPRSPGYTAPSKQEECDQALGDWKFRQSESRENEFLYGKEDPQGYRCPYGSHIRRANPRDSLHPDNPDQLEISNRHRILRRGRSYATAGESPSQGLLFMCLNADIERQFEFIQQTWMSSPKFHSLDNEPDPVAGLARSTTSPNDSYEFTVPTEAGPTTMRNLNSFLTVRNGGYFFVPSRSALLFLALYKQFDND